MAHHQTQISPLAGQLQELVSQGVVTPSYLPVSAFPSAYVVIPVYDSGNASGLPVLTVHHCFMHTMTSTTAIKVVENHEGRAAVRHVAQQTQPQTISIGLGSPA